MQDPYQVLGVSRDASEDEIKAAYRKKVKECHPDLHPDDPDATRKMNEINNAYDAIKDPAKAQPQWNGYSQSSYGPYSYQEPPYYSTSYETRDDQDLRTALHYINAGAFQEALHVLSTIPAEKRGGSWYYLSAVANYSLGNRVSAMEHIRRAVQMEPGNREYQALYQAIHSSSERYTGTGQHYGFRVSSEPDMCRSICFALCLCNFCMGGNFIFCC